MEKWRNAKMENWRSGEMEKVKDDGSGHGIVGPLLGVQARMRLFHALIRIPDNAGAGNILQNAAQSAAPPYLLRL